MSELPDRLSASMAVDEGYARRVGRATTIFVWLRLRAVRSAFLLAVGVLLLVGSALSGSTIGAILGAVLIVLQALIPISIAAAVAGASRRTSPPGSHLVLRIDEQEIELASVATTVRIPRSEIDRVERRLGFVWLRRGRRTAWIGVPESLFDGEVDAVADAPPRLGAPPSPRGDGAPGETRVIVDAAWIRAAGRSLVLVLLPWTLVPVAVGIALAGVVLADAGSLDGRASVILAVILVAALALSAGALAIGMRRSLVRHFPTGSEIRLSVDERTLRLQTPRGSVERALSSVVRIRRRGSILSLRLRGPLWSWVPGALLDDQQLAQIRALIGGRPA